MSMTEQGIVFAHPHWPGVFICEKRNRPAFETKEAMHAFQQKYCPSLRVVKEGRCKFCGKHHWIGARK